MVQLFKTTRTSKERRRKELSTFSISTRSGVDKARPVCARAQTQALAVLVRVRECRGASFGILKKSIPSQRI
ncbi:hypothetical protein EVAR_18106_1 [Eumeta japonica]|uniref:Uncharacterized protein n=1 Tax=Eumeta variegata TaxID=151549 RepID=A0A4C1VIV7_EUMVA|nr:hypothetical protein EVAR_18106_1 [Eumeta japonica]